MNPNNIITKKLNFSDYAFEYKSESLTNATLEYYFNKIECTKYKDAKRKQTTFKPTIEFNISAIDNKNKLFSLSFILELDINTLNNLSTNITTINDYVVDNEVFFTNPYTNNTKQIYKGKATDKYSNPSNWWASKIEPNHFFIKISIPEENIFIWFNIDFI